MLSIIVQCNVIPTLVKAMYPLHSTGIKTTPGTGGNIPPKKVLVDKFEQSISIQTPVGKPAVSSTPRDKKPTP